MTKTQYQFRPLVAQSDVHIHSTFSDGKNTIQEMVNAASKLQLKTVAISDHAPIPIECPCNMKEDQFSSYIKTIDDLIIPHSRIKILKALELDYLEGKTPLSKDIIEQLDLTIGSVHFLKFKNEFKAIDESPACFKELLNHFGDISKFARAYTQALAECVQIYNPTILGHIDLFIKFNEQHLFFDESAINWEEIYAPLFSSLPRSTAIEINTGAISRGYKTKPYPNVHLLKVIKKFKDIKLIINSDAHSTNGIKSHFEEAASIISELNMNNQLYSIL